MAERPAISLYPGVDPILGVRTAGFLERDKPGVTGAYHGAIYQFADGTTLYAYRTRGGTIVVRACGRGG